MDLRHHRRRGDAGQPRPDHTCPAKSTRYQTSERRAPAKTEQRARDRQQIDGDDGAELAEAYRSGLARHRDGARATSGRLSELGGLAHRVDASCAAAIIATLTRLEVWSSLRDDFGWDYDAAEAWIVRTLDRQILRPNQS